MIHINLPKSIAWPNNPIHNKIVHIWCGIYYIWKSLLVPKEAHVLQYCDEIDTPCLTASLELCILIKQTPFIRISRDNALWAMFIPSMRIFRLIPKWLRILSQSVGRDRGIIDNPWWRHDMEIFSTLLAFVRGILRSAQKDSVGWINVFFVVRINKVWKNCFVAVDLGFFDAHVTSLIWRPFFYSRTCSV